MEDIPTRGLLVSSGSRKRDSAGNGAGTNTRNQEAFFMVKCERCKKRPAEFIQIMDFRKSGDNWFASCGCGKEGMYAIHVRGFWPDMANHIASKRWSTPERIAKFLEIANLLDKVGDYKVDR